MNWKNVCYMLLICGLFACQEAQQESVVGNPAAEGFNLEGSDEEAIAIADKVMESMGGRSAWDATRYIRWTFFGRRTLLWDKKTGNVRIDVPEDNTVYLVNVNDGSGKVQLKGQDISATDTLSTYLERAKSIWINDSYWLLMPFKLKDSGVTLKYVGQDSMQTGSQAEVLQLTFEEVGNTPENKYLVYVDPADNLVKQWDFYTKAQDDSARFSTPWANYQPHGDLLLSGDRGRSQLTDIQVFEEVPASAFTDFNAPDLSEK